VSRIRTLSEDVVNRIAMLFAAGKSLRDVIAFPKTAKAQDLMADSPSEVGADQLRELWISLIRPADEA
jgi:aspartyl-tRNA synthetase